MITQKINVNLIPSGIKPRVNVSQYDYGSRTLEISLYNGTVPFTIPQDSNVIIQGTKKDGRGFQYEGLDYNGNVVTCDITQQMTVFEDEVATEIVINTGTGDDAEQLATANFIINVEPAALRDDTVVSETDIPAIQTLPEAMAEVREAVISTEEDALAADASATEAESYAKGGTGTRTEEDTDNALYYKQQAAGSATGAAASATLSESYAVGGTGTRAGEDNDNAKKYKEQAGEYANSAAGSASDAAASELNAASSERNAGTSETNAGLSATSANADALKAEGFAVGKQNGQDVGPSSEYYQNSAKYFKEQAEAIAGGHVVLYDPQQLTDEQKAQVRTNIGAPNTLNGQTDTDFHNLQDGESPIWDATHSKWVNGSAGTHIVQAPVPKTKTYTYDGTTQTFEWDSIDSNLVIVTNGLQVDAGTYSVICSLKNANDVWTDMTNTPKTFAWVIGKAAGDFTLSANSASVTQSNPTATVNVTNITGDGVMSVSSSDSTVATASYSNGVVTITGLYSGTATIVVSLAEGTNYLAKSKTISVTASGFMATFTVNGGYEDDITIKSADGQATIATVVFETGETSKQVSVPVPANGEYLFSSLDYDHTDGTADKMEKVIKVDGNTTNVDVMPSGSQYYRGNECNNTWVSDTYYESTSRNSVKNNDYVALNQSAIRTSSVVALASGEKIKALVDTITADGGYGVHMIAAPQTTDWSNHRDAESSTGETGTNQIISANILQAFNDYLYAVTFGSTRSGKLKAYWKEAKRSLPVGDTMNVTLTIEGAKDDNITIYDKYGEVVDYVEFATDAISATVTLAIRTGGEKLKFVSSVAKDTTDATKNYYKWIEVDDETTNVKLYPTDSNGYPTEFSWFGSDYGYTDKVPYMTSDTTPSGLITYDSQRSDTPWYKCFNNDGSLSEYASGLHWVQYTFANTVSFVHGIYFHPRGSWDSYWYHGTFVLTVNYGEADEETYEFTPTQTEWETYGYYVYAVINKQNVKNFRISMKTAATSSIYFAINAKIKAYGE